MSTLQDEDLQYENTTYTQNYPKNKASLAFYDILAQHGDADEDLMDLDQALMQADPACSSQDPSDGLELGKKFYTAEDSFSDNSYLAALLPHWNSESGVDFKSPSASYSIGNHLSDIRKQHCGQEDYGYQPQAQDQPAGNEAAYPADSNSSSTIADNGGDLKEGVTSHSSMPLRVDFSAFHDQMRQYQQAAIARQSNNSSTMPHFQQSPRSEVSIPAHSAHAQSTRVSADTMTTLSLRHSSSTSKESSADIGDKDRRWLNWVEQASQEQEFDAAANENPSNAYFARHSVSFPRVLWEASDISRENGIMSHRISAKPPALDQHVPAGDLRSVSSSPSLLGQVRLRQGQPAFQSHALVPERSTTRRHLGDVNKFEVIDGSAIRAEDSSMHQVWDPSSHQHASQQAGAYVGVNPSLSFNNQMVSGTSARHTAPDWSQVSRQRLRKIAPIQIPKSSSRSTRDFAGAQTSLCTPGSSTGPFHSLVDAVSSPRLSAPSLKRKGSTASSIQEAASQSISGRGSYECNICGRKFSRPSALVVHERAHSGERPYLCETCNRAFTVASNLRRHQKTHSQQLEQIDADTAKSDETIGASTAKQKDRRRKRYQRHPERGGNSQDSDLSRENE